MTLAILSRKKLHLYTIFQMHIVLSSLYLWMHMATLHVTVNMQNTCTFVLCIYNRDSLDGRNCTHDC